MRLRKGDSRSSMTLRRRDKPPQFYEELIPQFFSDDEIPEASSSQKTLDHSRHSPESIEDTERSDTDSNSDVVFVGSKHQEDKDACQKCFAELQRIRREVRGY